jgi:hypothetical protein
MVKFKLAKYRLNKKYFKPVLFTHRFVEMDVEKNKVAERDRGEVMAE